MSEDRFYAGRSLIGASTKTPKTYTLTEGNLRDLRHALSMALRANNIEDAGPHIGNAFRILLSAEQRSARSRRL